MVVWVIAKTAILLVVRISYTSSNLFLTLFKFTWHIFVPFTLNNLLMYDSSLLVAMSCCVELISIVFGVLADLIGVVFPNGSWLSRTKSDALLEFTLFAAI